MKSKKKKTALVLGGGGSRGAYEAGVWQALTELGIEIDIVTGTSVGAINAAMVVQGDVDLTAQLWREIETHMVFDVPEGSQPIEYAREIVFHHGAGTSRLKELLDTYIDEDQIRSAAMDYGIPVVSLPAFEAHYLFKEDIPAGRLTDYIVASASAFPAIHSYEIDGVDYIDGGYADEIPVNMAMQKGATHVIAVNLKGMGLVKYDSIKKAPNLVYIEPKWDLGNIHEGPRTARRRFLCFCQRHVRQSDTQSCRRLCPRLRPRPARSLYTRDFPRKDLIVRTGCACRGERGIRALQKFFGIIRTAESQGIARGLQGHHRSAYSGLPDCLQPQGKRRKQPLSQPRRPAPAP